MLKCVLSHPCHILEVQGKFIQHFKNHKCKTPCDQDYAFCLLSQLLDGLYQNAFEPVQKAAVTHLRGWSDWAS